MIKRINIRSYQSWLWHVIDYIALKFFQKPEEEKVSFNHLYFELSIGLTRLR